MLAPSPLLVVSKMPGKKLEQRTKIKEGSAGRSFYSFLSSQESPVDWASRLFGLWASFGVKKIGSYHGAIKGRNQAHNIM